MGSKKRETTNETAKGNVINHKHPAICVSERMKQPTAAQVQYWDTRLTRMGCSIHRGNPAWLKYEYEIGDFFLAAVAEYAYPARKHRTGAKPQAE